MHSVMLMTPQVSNLWRIACDICGISCVLDRADISDKWVGVFLTVCVYRLVHSRMLLDPLACFGGEASMRATNSMPLRQPMPLIVAAMNCVETLKAPLLAGVGG
jgi:hypothetical protein